MENMQLQIDKVTSSELELLQRISRLTFFETFSNQNTPENMHIYLNSNMSLENLCNEYNNTDSSFYFIRINGNVAGYFKLNFSQKYPNNHEKKSLEIERLYLLKQVQNKGFGKQIMNTIFEVSKLKNISTIWLGVWENNEPAIAFYKKMGFEEFGNHQFKLGLEVQIDKLLKINL